MGGGEGRGVDEWASLCVEVRSARQGNDVLIWLPTGTGKTYIVLKYAEVGGVGAVVNGRVWGFMWRGQQGQVKRLHLVSHGHGQDLHRAEVRRGESTGRGVG